MVVIYLEGGLIEAVTGIADYIVVNFDVPEDKNLWKEFGVCLGCAVHTKPATHG